MPSPVVISRELLKLMNEVLTSELHFNKHLTAALTTGDDKQFNSRGYLEHVLRQHKVDPQDSQRFFATLEAMKQASDAQIKQEADAHQVIQSLLAKLDSNGEESIEIPAKTWANLTSYYLNLDIESYFTATEESGVMYTVFNKCYPKVVAKVDDMIMHQGQQIQLPNQPATSLYKEINHGFGGLLVTGMQRATRHNMLLKTVNKQIEDLKAMQTDPQATLLVEQTHKGLTEISNALVGKKIKQMNTRLGEVEAQFNSRKKRKRRSAEIPSDLAKAIDIQANLTGRADANQTDEVIELFNNNQLLVRAHEFDLRINYLAVNKNNAFLNEVFEFNAKPLRNELKFIHQPKDAKGNSARQGNRGAATTLLIPGIDMHLFGDIGLLHDADECTVRGYSLQDANSNLRDNSFCNVVKDKAEFAPMRNRAEFVEAYKQHYAQRQQHEPAYRHYNEVAANIYPDSIKGLVFKGDDVLSKMKAIAAQNVLKQRYDMSLPLYHYENGQLQAFAPSLDEVSQMIQSLPDNIERLLDEQIRRTPSAQAKDEIRADLKKQLKNKKLRQKVILDLVAQMGYTCELTVGSHGKVKIAPDSIQQVKRMQDPLSREKEELQRSVRLIKRLTSRTLAGRDIAPKGKRKRLAKLVRRHGIRAEVPMTIARVDIKREEAPNTQVAADRPRQPSTSPVEAAVDLSPAVGLQADIREAAAHMPAQELSADSVALKEAFDRLDAELASFDEMVASIANPAPAPVVAPIVPQSSVEIAKSRLKEAALGNSAPSKSVELPSNVGGIVSQRRAFFEGLS